VHENAEHAIRVVGIEEDCRADEAGEYGGDDHAGLQGLPPHERREQRCRHDEHGQRAVQCERAHVGERRDQQEDRGVDDGSASASLERAMEVEEEEETEGQCATVLECAPRRRQGVVRHGGGDAGKDQRQHRSGAAGAAARANWRTKRYAGTASSTGTVASVHRTAATMAVRWSTMIERSRAMAAWV